MEIATPSLTARPLHFSVHKKIPSTRPLLYAWRFLFQWTFFSELYTISILAFWRAKH